MHSTGAFSTQNGVGVLELQCSIVVCGPVIELGDESSAFFSALPCRPPPPQQTKEERIRELRAAVAEARGALELAQQQLQDSRVEAEQVCACVCGGVGAMDNGLEFLAVRGVGVRAGVGLGWG